MRLILCLLPLVALPVAAEKLYGKVVAITDGDTLTVLIDRTQHRVRLDQIDTPEKGQNWGNRARQALSDKVLRMDVGVEVSGTDQYDRLLGTIILGDRNINREMVREGHAWAYKRYVRDRSLLSDQRSAEEQGLGLWSLADPVPPWEWRRNEAKGVSTENAKCTIKGNISSKGTRIYHVPGQKYYRETKISKSKGERWFCSESQARDAGWRKAKT